MAINLGNAVITVTANPAQFTGPLGQAGQYVDNFGLTIRSLGRGLRELAFGFSVVGAGIATAFASIIKEGAALDTTVKTIELVSSEIRALDRAGQDVNPTLAKVRSGIVDLARYTQFTAIEIGKAAEVLVRAGVKLNDIFPEGRGSGGLAALAAQLASFDNIPVDKAADLLIATVKTFGAQEDELGKKSTELAAVLATATSLTNNNITQLARSVQYGGQSLKAANIDITEGIAALATLGDVGRRGSAGGTGIQALIDNLAVLRDSAKRTQIAINAGLDPDKLNPYNHTLIEIVGNLKEAVDTAAGGGALILRQLTDVRGFRALAGLVLQYDKFKEIIEETKINAVDLAKALELRLQSPEAKIKLLESAFSALLQVLYDLISADFGQFVDKLTEGINTIVSFVQRNKELVRGVMETIAAMGAFSIGIAAVLLPLGTLIVSAGFFVEVTIRLGARLTALAATNANVAASFAILRASLYALNDPVLLLTSTFGILQASLLRISTFILGSLRVAILAFGTDLATVIVQIGAFSKALLSLRVGPAIAALQTGFGALGNIFVTAGAGLRGFTALIGKALSPLLGLASTLGIFISAAVSLAPVLKGIASIFVGFFQGLVSGFTEYFFPIFESGIKLMESFSEATGITSRELTFIFKQLGVLIGNVLGIIVGFISASIPIILSLLGFIFKWGFALFGLSATYEELQKKLKDFNEAIDDEAKKAEDAENRIRDLAKAHAELNALFEDPAIRDAIREMEEFIKVSGEVSHLKLSEFVNNLTTDLERLSEGDATNRFTDELDKLRGQLAQAESAVEEFSAGMTAAEQAGNSIDFSKFKQQVEAAQYAAELARQAIARLFKTQTQDDDTKLLEERKRLIEARLENEKNLSIEKVKELKQEQFDIEQELDRINAERRIKNDIVDLKKRKDAQDLFNRTQAAQKEAFDNSVLESDKELTEKRQEFAAAQQRALFKNREDAVAEARIEAAQYLESAEKQIDALKLVGEERERQLELAKQVSQAIVDDAVKKEQERVQKENTKTRREEIKEQRRLFGDIGKERLQLETSIASELGKQARTVYDLYVLFSFLDQLEQQRVNRATAEARRAIAIQNRLERDQANLERRAARGEAPDALQQRVLKRAQQLALQIGLTNKQLGAAGIEPLDGLLNRVGLSFFNYGESVDKVNGLLKEAQDRFDGVKNVASGTLGVIQELINTVPGLINFANIDFTGVINGVGATDQQFQGLIQTLHELFDLLAKLPNAAGALNNAAGGLQAPQIPGPSASAAVGGAGPAAVAARAGNLFAGGAVGAGTSRVLNDSRRVDINVRSNIDLQETSKSIGAALTSAGFAAELI